MWWLFFKQKAQDQLEKINKINKLRIKEKLVFYSSQKNPLQFAKKLISPEIWTYRFRIWDYRVIFDLDEKWRIIIIALIWHRKEMYK